MKTLVMALILLSPVADAAIGMKPGLWNLNMRIKSDGKDMNPSSVAKPKLEMMPAGERQKVLRLMGASGDTQACYSQKIIEKPESLAKVNPECESTLVKNTTNMVMSSFKCKDGTTGDSSWSLKNPDALMGLVNYRDPKGKTTQVTYDGKFVHADCGKVRPVL